MSKSRPRRHAIEEPRTLPLPPPGYQRSKAELEKEFDMPASPTSRPGSGSPGRSGSCGRSRSARDREYGHERVR